MAIVDVKVPQFSESVEEGTLISWKKKPGEAVAVDEVLVEIETDKVVLEVPAPSAGVLAEVLVADGATVTSEQLLAKIDTEGKAGAAAPAAAPAPAAAAPAPVAAAPAAAAATGGVAMPSAAKLMAENNLSAGQVAGTGRDGRITKGDVIDAAARGTANAAPAAVSTAHSFHGANNQRGTMVRPVNGRKSSFTGSRVGEAKIVPNTETFRTPATQLCS